MSIHHSTPYYLHYYSILTLKETSSHDRLVFANVHAAIEHMANWIVPEGTGTCRIMNMFMVLVVMKLPVVLTCGCVQLPFLAGLVYNT